MRTPLSPIAHLAARTGRRAAALLVALALLVSIVPAALAAGEPTGSKFEWGGAPPASLVPGAVESDAHMFVYAEQTNFALTRDVDVDFTQPGTYDESGDLPATAPTIADGTIVNSYYIHADQTTAFGRARISTTITFPDPIIGVILTGGRLTASEAVLGVAETDYPTSGYELVGRAAIG